MSLKKLSGDCLKRVLSRLDKVEHVKIRNMTYSEHFLVATYMGVDMIKGGVLLLVHAVFPNYFQSSGSDIIRNLHKKL
jgi:hypothetical protein